MQTVFTVSPTGRSSATSPQIMMENGPSRQTFTFLRVKVSCLLPTAVLATLLVPECSSNFKRSSNEALER